MSFLGLGAKKFFMSRVSDTKVGRAQLLKQVGDDTANMLEALATAVEKFADKPTADEVSKATLKLAVKVGLLWREKVVTPEAAAPLRDPMIECATRLIEALETRPGAVDPAPASASIKAVIELLVAVCKPHMKEKNWQRMAALGGYYSDAAFLTFLFNSPLLHPQRDTLLTLLHAFMAPHGGAGSRKRTQQCVVPGCELPRLAIRGAQYCLGHQATKYAEGPPPRLEDFMHNMDHAAVFKEYLLETVPAYTLLLEAHSACKDYASNTSRALLKARAPALFDRYFRSPGVSGDKYIPLPDDIKVPLQWAIDGFVVPPSALDEDAGSSSAAEGAAESSSYSAGAAASSSASSAAGSAATGGAAASSSSSSSAAAAAAAAIDYSAAPPPITSRTFEPVAAWAYGHLEELYLSPSFRESPQYAAWAAENLGYAPPPISSARAALLTAMGISIDEVIPGGGAAAVATAGGSAASSAAGSAAAGGAGTRHTAAASAGAASGGAAAISSAGGSAGGSAAGGAALGTVEPP